MKKTRIKFGYVFASVVLVLLIAAAVIRVKSYCNTGAVIGSYTVASKEVVIKIKYAKQHDYTFLYNNEKVNIEDFGYKNSDVVVLNDLKLVIGMPK